MDRNDDAVALLQQTLETMREALGAGHPETLACMIQLGSVYADQHKQTEAEPLLLEAQQGFAQRNDSSPTPYDAQQCRKALEQLVQLYGKSDQPDKAAAWKEKLNALKEEPEKNEGDE